MEHLPISKRANGMAGIESPYVCLKDYDNEDFLTYPVRTETLPALTVSDKTASILFHQISHKISSMPKQ